MLISVLSCGVKQCRLARLKSESRKKREEREQLLAASVLEMNRRKQIIEEQFYEWNNGCKVELSFVQNALLSCGATRFELIRTEESVEASKAVFLADYLLVCISYFLFWFCCV
jgi:hypothetical protein